MHDSILTSVKKFLKKQTQGDRPLLMGFSGGPDSLALLHLLHACRCNLHVAHVDHGWRPESEKEAEELRGKSLGYPFHLHRLIDAPHKEEAARQGRLKFFRKIYDQFGCQALVLGHQANDQSETVLKRIFEGASLGALGGIRAVTKIEEMQVWRPLLSLQKKDLEAWIRKRSLIPLEDKTNLDPKYTRGRMRSDILPHLSRQFGKEVSGNLCRLGEFAQEVDDYFERKIQKYIALVKETENEIAIDLSSMEPFEAVEIKFFLKKITEKNKIFLAHSTIQNLYEILEKGEGCKKIGAGGRWIEIRRRSIAIKKPSDYLGQ